MRSMNSQVNNVFKDSEIFQPGVSKTEADPENVRSYRTAEAYKDIWHQCANYTKQEFRVFRVSDIQPSHVRAFLNEKIVEGKAKKTIQNMCAALEKFETALNRTFPEKTFDFSSTIQETREYARDVMTTEHHDRAYKNPSAIISRMTDPINRLVANLQAATGCRFGEIAQLNTTNEKSNHFPGGDVLTTWGKGGFEITKELPPQLMTELRAVLAENGGKMPVNYLDYLNDLKGACKATGERYEGSHGFRYKWVQDKYNDYLSKGYSRQAAMKQTSEDIGHHRAEITAHYL